MASTSSWRSISRASRNHSDFATLYTARNLFYLSNHDAEKNPTGSCRLFLCGSDPPAARLHRVGPPLVGMDGADTVSARCARSERGCRCGPAVADPHLRSYILLRHLSVGRDAGHHGLDWQKGWSQETALFLFARKALAPVGRAGGVCRPAAERADGHGQSDSPLQFLWSHCCPSAGTHLPLVQQRVGPAGRTGRKLCLLRD